MDYFYINKSIRRFIDDYGVDAMRNNSDVQEGLARARRFVITGGEQILDGTLDEKHGVSPSPGATALASLALLTLGKGFEKAQKKSAVWLLKNQNADQGWGKFPGDKTDPEITQVVQTVLRGSQGGLLAKFSLLSQARRFSRMILTMGEGVAPGLKGPSPEEIILPNILEGRVLAKLPQYGRPVVVAASLLAADSRQSGVDRGVDYLWSTQAEDGSWSEDIVATSLAILALQRHRRDGHKTSQAGRWLESRQYANGSWPAFDQLKTWAMGWAACILSENGLRREEIPFLKETGEWLLKAQNEDGSYGCTPPYTHPDLDNTAVALLGMGTLKIDNQKSVSLLKRLQNPEGSWGTFPDFSGSSPQIECKSPVYIDSNDVTIHVLEALERHLSPRDPDMRRGLSWLLSHQVPNGEIASMWFEESIYSTAQFLELFGHWNVRQEEWAMARKINQARYLGERFILETQNNDGSWGKSSAETALALAPILRNPDRNMRAVSAKGIKALLANQQEDGSFAPVYQGIYAKGWNYEEPIATTLTAIRALERYLLNTERSINRVFLS